MIQMRLRFPLLVAALLSPAVAKAQTWTDFQVGGTTRKALVYVPSGIENPPLLISLHGMGIGASWNQGGMMKFEPIADREKFIVVYPEADQDLKWDLGGTHDVDFVLKIIDDMSAQYEIDQNRVYASGFSMGGMFSYTLACKIPGKIAAIAPGNGYPLGGLSGCDSSRPVPIFHMHGTADDFVGYSGIHAFLETRVAAYGCPTDPETTDPYPTDKPASKSFKETWAPCSDEQGKKSEVILVSVAGMIHDWATAGKANANTDPEFAGKPFDIDGSEEAWAFLRKHSLNEEPTAPGSGGAGGTGGVAATGGSAVGTGGTGPDGASTGGTSSGGQDPGSGGSGGADGADGSTAADGGCSCRVASGPQRRSAGAWMLLVAVGALYRQRLQSRRGPAQ